MNVEINLDQVEIIDANEVGLTLLANAPKEEIPQGAKFDGVTCVDCGFEIEPARLISVPNTCRCGECKMWHDKDNQRKALNGNPDYVEE